MKDFAKPIQDNSYMVIKSRLMQGALEGLLFVSFEDEASGRSASVALDKEKAKEFRDLLDRYLKGN